MVLLSSEDSGYGIACPQIGYGTRPLAGIDFGLQIADLILLFNIGLIGLEAVAFLLCQLFALVDLSVDQRDFLPIGGENLLLCRRLTSCA